MVVKMSEEVWLTCLSHALTTETEEIMGLLFGDIQVKTLFFFILVVIFEGLGFIWVLASQKVRYCRVLR